MLSSLSREVWRKRSSRLGCAKCFNFQPFSPCNIPVNLNIKTVPYKDSWWTLIKTDSLLVYELLHHLHECQKSVKNFCGRELELRKLRNYLTGDSCKTPLFVFGKGGSGKTALLCQACHLLQTEWVTQGILCIMSSSGQKKLRWSFGVHQVRWRSCEGQVKITWRKGDYHSLESG